MPQQYDNHGRYIPLWHFITSGIMLAIFIGSIVNMVRSTPANLCSASLLFATSLVLFSLFWYSRWFALRVQDRAIRAEENLRHFAMTGKLLDSRLRMRQIIALRFASDEEFVALAKKAAEEHIPGKEIKKMIKNWRPDDHRA